MIPEANLVKTDDEAAQLVKALQARWSGAFESGDRAELASFYTPDAQFFGGKPRLYQGIQEIQRYFESVPPGGMAIFQEEMVATRIAPHLVMFSGFVDFRREGRVRMHRMTWVMSRIEEQWKIVAHHASPVPTI